MNQLTFPTLLSVASENAIPTLDNCHSRSFAIADGMEVDCVPAITGSAINQSVGEDSACHLSLQTISQDLAVLCGQN